tara:strand:+ start:381 stop:1217 length:837 start_codon:yes stop_codon:yes gene_type:complete
MADSKISALTALESNASDDVLAIVDTSATATKKVTVENIFKGIPVSVGVNESTPLAKLHVVRDAVNHSTQSSLAPIYVEDDTRPGIFISGNLNNIGIIQFGDNSAINSGEIFYDHSADKFSLRCAGTVQATLADGVFAPETDSDVDLGTTSLRFKDTFVDTITTTEAINGALKRWTVKTSAYTAVAGDRLLADTATTAAFTITLPSSPSVGDEIHILDSAANFDSANLTVGRNGKKIQGLTADLTLTTENTGIGLVFMSDTYGWRVLVDAYAVDTTEL